MDHNLGVLVTDRSVLPFKGIILASVPSIIPEGYYEILLSLNWPRAAGLSALFANILATSLPFCCDLTSVFPFQHLIGFRKNWEIKQLMSS